VRIAWSFLVLNSVYVTAFETRRVNTYRGFTCPSCGNEKGFLAKTLQTYIVQAGGRELEISEQSRPALFELLCDECESELDFGSLDADLRREMPLLLGAD